VLFENEEATDDWCFRGRYFGPGVKEETPHVWGDDETKANNLYDFSIAFLKGKGYL